MAEYSRLWGTCSPTSSSSHLDLLGLLQEALARASPAVLIHDLSNKNGEHVGKRSGVEIIPPEQYAIIEAHPLTKERAPFGAPPHEENT